MHLNHDSFHSIKSQVLAILDKHLGATNYKAFFFGSRITGRGSERSDIDIGIQGTQRIPYGVWGDIAEEIEDIPTLYTIDIVDFQRVSPEFRCVALQQIEQLRDTV